MIIENHRPLGFDGVQIAGIVSVAGKIPNMLLNTRILIEDALHHRHLQLHIGLPTGKNKQNDVAIHARSVSRGNGYSHG
jgi:hypothetical protein